MWIRVSCPAEEGSCAIYTSATSTSVVLYYTNYVLVVKCTSLVGVAWWRVGCRVDKSGWGARKGYGGKTGEAGRGFGVPLTGLSARGWGRDGIGWMETGVGFGCLLVACVPVFGERVGVGVWFHWITTSWVGMEFGAYRRNEIGRSRFWISRNVKWSTHGHQQQGEDALTAPHRNLDGRWCGVCADN